MQIYSGLIFFASLFALSFWFLGFKNLKASIFERFYPYLIVIFSLVATAFIYGASAWKPLLFVLFGWSAFELNRVNKLSKKSAIILTLIPLVSVKLGALSFFAMVGLSFVTFRAIDILLFSKDKDLVKFPVYICYLVFPLTLLAGPMYRWTTFISDIKLGSNRISLNNFLAGVEILLLGIAQKFLIADIINEHVLSELPKSDYSLSNVMATALVYSVFLYFDFAGYSNMAVGSGRMLGLQLPENFKNPVAAKNPQDFWRRWHISLSEWLRDVVFMPLYIYLSKKDMLSKKKLLVQNVTVFATLFVMGIWNGISMNYVVSGVMFGFYSVIYNLMLAYKNKPIMAFMFGSAMICYIGRVFNLVLVMLALYIFSGRGPV